MQQNNVFSLYPETFVVASGTTVLIPVMPLQNSAWIQYGSGGSLFLLGSSLTSGSTFASSNLYPVPATGAMEIHLMGPLNFYVAGTTTTFYLARGFSEGSTQT